MEAAVRECNEETGLKTGEYKIIEDAPTFQEVFLELTIYDTNTSIFS